MPIYEFKCEKCGKIVEKLQRMSDPYPAACEFCHEGPMKKLISSSGFVLKGSGWYVTDFKKSGSTASSPTSPSQSSSSAESKEASPSASSSTTKSPSVDK